MNKKLPSLIVTLFFPLILTCAALAQEAARVNDRIITQEQVSAHLNEIARGNSGDAPTRKSAVEALVKREIAIQEAKRLKLDQDRSTIDRMNNVLYYALIEKKLGPDFEKANVTDAEAKNWYEKNPEIRTSQIFIALPPGAKAEDEKKATERLNSIYKDLKVGKISFGEAAQQFSEDQSASSSGDMGYLSKDRVDPRYINAALKLGKLGDFTTPTRAANGVSIIRLTGKHSWSEVDRSRVKRLVIDEKRQAIIDRYLNDLRQKATVIIK